MTQRIRKAVFPVAGLGTRFLPATKTVPKEMLPIIDRPLIQYAVDEAVEAGCDTLIFVTNRYKHAIGDYFDKAYELEHRCPTACARSSSPSPRRWAWATRCCAPSRSWATSRSR
jgi:UTP--glucose-1-phosphate uridylyltransferase